MKVTHRVTYSYEWSEAALISERALSDKELDQLKEFLNAWPLKKTEDLRAGHVHSVEPSDDHKTVRMILYHWPEEWIKPLARSLARKFPSFRLFEIGKEFEPAFRDDAAFVAVPRKTVVFEDDSKAQVQPFQIAKYPVSVEQFERFVRDTGYVTVAEQKNHDQTFRDNQYMDGVVKSKCGKLPALFVSYVDAMAYCEWALVRLPTEAEWIAAAVIEDRVYGKEAVDQSLLDQLRKRPEALIRENSEITGTTVVHPKFGKECVIIRSGPYLVRTREMMHFPHHRRLVSLKNYEDYEGFRVCKR